MLPITTDSNRPTAEVHCGSFGLRLLGQHVREQCIRGVQHVGQIDQLLKAVGVHFRTV